MIEQQNVEDLSETGFSLVTSIEQEKATNERTRIVV